MTTTDDRSDTDLLLAYGRNGEQASEKVEREADSRAFMFLIYGGLADVMDSSNVRRLANMVKSHALLAVIGGREPSMVRSSRFCAEG